VSATLSQLGCQAEKIIIETTAPVLHQCLPIASLSMYRDIGTGVNSTGYSSSSDILDS